MASYEEFQLLKEHNRNMLNWYRDLNRRAGTEVQYVPTRDDLAEAFADVLNGARSIEGIRNIDNLRLPEPPADLVTRVMSASPDSLLVLGRARSVQYRDDAPPLLKLGQEMVMDRSFYNLPDEGISTPGGRAVEYHIWDKWYNEITAATVPELKAKVIEHLRRQVFEQCRQPNFETPDITALQSAPDIIPQEYGRCPVTGEILHAYRTLVYYESWLSSPRLEWKYFFTREEAEQARSALTARLEMVQAKLTAKTLQTQLYILRTGTGDAALYSQLQAWGTASLPSDLAGLQRWISTARELKVKAEAARSKFQQVEKEAGSLQSELRNLPTSKLSINTARLVHEYSSYILPEYQVRLQAWISEARTLLQRAQGEVSAAKATERAPKTVTTNSNKPQSSPPPNNDPVAALAEKWRSRRG